VTEARLLAVVPARAGSRGLPGKNLRPLKGIPLVVHSIKAAAMVPSITRCVVSTDSDEIAEVVRAEGGEAPFSRPAKLATDTAPMAPVVRHALQWCEEEEGRPYDAVVLLDPTSPLRRPDQLGAAIDLLLGHDDLDGVVSVSEPTFNPIWVGVRGGDSPAEPLTRFFDEGAGVTRRQDAERFLRINGSFYVWRADFVRRLQSSWFDEGRHSGFVIPESQACSIDDEYEFRLVEALVDSGLATLPWMGGEAQ
jgi:N-acylneuraminate cytidylyltransferase